MAKLAKAAPLKGAAPSGACGFESRPGHSGAVLARKPAHRDTGTSGGNRLACDGDRRADNRRAWRQAGCEDAEVARSQPPLHAFGGHLFSIYDGCREEGIDIVDVRHEQTAAFAAEGFAKATRRVGVAALTAGPGVTNGVSAIASAQANCSPLCVLGGRAPELRWGAGSLQEIDHLPFVRRWSSRPRPLRSRTGSRRARRRRLTWRLPRRAARPSSTTRSTWSSARRRLEIPPLPQLRPAARRGGGGGGGAAGGGRAAGDHGRDRALLGPRRGRAAGTGRGARHSGLSQRPWSRLSARRPRAGLQPRARRRPAGRRRGAGRRRSDRLPPRLRRELRRGDEAGPP